MLHYVAENPWPGVGILSVVALYFFLKMRFTQDGVYLTRLLVTIGLIVGFLVMERFWVTDNERIEAVVYELARGMEASDGDRVVATFAPQISIGMRNRNESVAVDPDRFRQTLKNLQFDWLRITRLTTRAGEQTKQGSAEFRVNASGSISTAFGTRFNFATGNSEWSLGLRKMPDSTWKVTRINPVSIPQYAVNSVETYIMMVAKGVIPTRPSEPPPRRFPGGEPLPPGARPQRPFLGPP